MANATVEKLKAFGIRHGEKVAIGLAGAICLVLVGLAWSHPVIDVTAEDVQKTADAARQNIQKPQSKEAIIALLDEANLKNPGFLKKVEDNKPGTVDPAKYAFVGPSFVSPEPGAGLIRDMPELIAPIELAVNSGRGSIKVFKHDEQTGEIIMSKEDEEKTPKKAPRKKSGRSAGMMGGAGGMMGGMRGAQKKKGGGQSEEEKAKAAEKAAREKAALIAGGGVPPEEEEKKKEDEVPQGKPEGVNKGYRWVALVGVLEHQKLRDNYTKALKNPGASPHYLRLDIERQAALDDGSWSKWTRVDHDLTENILAEIFSEDEEYTPENVRLQGLVDRLPFLEVGSWRGVHVGSLIAAEKRKDFAAPKKGEAKKKAGGMAGMYGGMGGMSGMAGNMMKGMSGMRGGAGGDGDYGEMMGRRGGAGGMSGMRGLGGMMGGGGGAEEGNYARTDAAKIMIRALDFQVDPDTSYRYRVRIVVANPNHNRDDVAPGVDTKSTELSGPWSEMTPVVNVPADVAVFARTIAPGSRGERISFQVAKWNEADGVTVVKNFEYGPGEIIGEQVSAYVPGPEDKPEPKAVPIDFTSRSVLLDTDGGERPLDALGTSVGRFEAPAMALTLRPDGTLVVRDQARDVRDPQMRQLKEIYDEILKAAREGGKKKPTGGMPGMMGSGGMGSSDL